MWDGGLMGVRGGRGCGSHLTYLFFRGNKTKERILLLLSYHDSNRLGIRGVYVN